MAHLIIELENEYRRIFGGRPYSIPGLSRGDSSVPGYRINGRKQEQTQTPKGGLLSEKLESGLEIWLPVKFLAPELPNGVLSLPYSVVRIDTKKRIIKTPLIDRPGTVKEQYSAEDYSINIKGFLIGADMRFPEEDLTNLKMLYQLNKAIELKNALTDIFLINEGEEKQKVVIEDMQLPEVEGGRKHVRPFALKLESDNIFTLEVDQ